MTDLLADDFTPNERAVTVRRPCIEVVIGKTPDGWAVKDVRLSDAAVTWYKTAMESAEAIARVENDKELEEAMHAAGFITDAHGKIEQSRITVKAAFLDACRKIDSKAGEYLKPLTSALVRIKSLIGQYEGEKERLERLRREELERQAAELALSAVKTDDEEQSEAFHEQAAEKMEEAARSHRRPVSGLGIRPTYKAVLNDFVKVANTNPHLLKHEVEVSAVNNMIRALSDGGKKPLAADVIPGMTLVPTTQVSLKR